MSKKQLKSIEDTEVFQKHYQYMQSVIPKLIEAERIVDSIKGSEQWTKSLNYFNVLHNRGKLACRPTKENGYTIKTVQRLRLQDIEDILTPEQMEIITKRLGKEN